MAGGLESAGPAAWVDAARRGVADSAAAAYALLDLR